MYFARKKISQNEKKLAITADDYGPHPFINRGVIKAVEENRVSSVGVMTNRYQASNDPGYTYDLQQEVETLLAAIDNRNEEKKAILPDIGVGVHLSVSSGSALTKNPFLIHQSPINVMADEEVMFQPIHEFRFSHAEEHLRATRDEVIAQILALKSILDKHDLKIDHISCHQGLLYLYHPYHTVFLEAVEDIYGDIPFADRPTIRNPIPISKKKNYRKLFKSEMKREGIKRAITQLVDDNWYQIFYLLRGTGENQLQARAAEFRRKGYTVPWYLFDHFYKQASDGQLRKMCKRYPTGYPVNLGELIVHLGDPFEYRADLKLPGINHLYFPGRKKELKALLKFPLLDSFERYNITYDCMGALKHPPDLWK